MRKTALLTGIAALTVMTACRQTGREGEYEVERPVIGTTVDTMRTPQAPDINVRRDTVQMEVPRVEIRRDTQPRRP